MTEPTGLKVGDTVLVKWYGGPKIPLYYRIIDIRPSKMNADVPMYWLDPPGWDCSGWCVPAEGIIEKQER